EHEKDEAVDQEGTVQRTGECPCRHERKDSVGEAEGEDQDVRDTVRGESLVVRSQAREVADDVHTGVRKGICKAVEHAGHERGVADVDGPAKYAALLVRQVVARRIEYGWRKRAHCTGLPTAMVAELSELADDAGSTTTRPTMWW